MSKLALKNTLFHLFPKQQYLISISGEGGVGKTTLALQLAEFYLSQGEISLNKCIWIQANEIFPIQRLRSLHKNDLQKLESLQRNILVFPKKGKILNYSSQNELLKSFSKRIFPSQLKTIIIDNISHHLRYFLMNHDDLHIRSKIIDEFYSFQIFPLIMRCQREKIYLILIHEVSFNPKAQKTQIFYSQLYNRLEMISIKLSKSIITPLKTLEIHDSISGFNSHHIYELTTQGICIL